MDAVDALEPDLGVPPSFEWLPRLLPAHSSIIGSITTSSEAPPPPLPYKVDTSRPSLRTNWTRLVPFPQATIASLNTVFTGEVYYRVAALKPVQVGPILEKFLKESQREGFQAEHYEAIRLAAPQSANLTGTPLNMSPLFMSLAWLISAEYPPPY